MKSQLPDNHGLSEALLKPPAVHFSADGATPSLTDAQYESLADGVARGESLLVVAPTSSGKTEIAMMAAASWLRRGDLNGNLVVYLVSHRALAKQKLRQFRQPDYLDMFDIKGRDLVMADGDAIRDGEGNIPADPLDSKLLIATYEKFQALIASQGIPDDLSHYCIVADEIQLLADDGRGQNVEILLTILSRASPGQFVGLSAVLNRDDADHLAGWMNTGLVFCETREIELHYELRTQDGTILWNPSSGRPPEQTQDKKTTGTLEIIAELMASDDVKGPVAVFCDSKPQVERLAESWSQKTALSVDEGTQYDFSFEEPTRSSKALTVYTRQMMAMHSADLTEAERLVVEDLLENEKLKVVFCTSTLAMGLNFSFSAVIFDSWKKWDTSGPELEHIPLTLSEFHNMAGRAGRLSKTEEGFGRVYFKSRRSETRQAAAYLTTHMERKLGTQISPHTFDLLSLQLLSAKVALTKQGILDFLLSTLSAEIARNAAAGLDAHWADVLDRAIDQLMVWGMISGDVDLAVTQVGRAVARSAILPITGKYFLDYLSEKGARLSEIIPSIEDIEDLLRFPGAPDKEADFAFLVFALCLTSPEYGTADIPSRRFIPYQLNQQQEVKRAVRLNDLLPIPQWDRDMLAINAAEILVDWVKGAPLDELEARYEKLRGGMIKESARTTASHLAALGDILTALINPKEELPAFAWVSVNIRDQFRQILGKIRQLSWQLTSGLPNNVIWLTDLTKDDGTPLIGREVARALHKASLTNMDDILDEDRKENLIEALKEAGEDPERFKEIRDSMRDTRVKRTEYRYESITKRSAKRCHSLIEEYANSAEHSFEDAVERVLQCTDIRITYRDGSDGKRGAPDFIIKPLSEKEVVLECKTKNAGAADKNKGDILLTTIADVASKAAIHGKNRLPMVTLCKPYAKSDVAGSLSDSKDLVAVNAEDFAEALLRLHLGKIDINQFATWLTTPGQARQENLP